MPADLRARLVEAGISEAWRGTIAGKEVGGEPHDGYGTSATEVEVDKQGAAHHHGGVRPLSDGANGPERHRYRVREPPLAGKYGIHSKQEFLTNPKAQEAARADFTSKLEDYLENNEHLFDDYKGQVITGLMGYIPITWPGLIAAAHRQGAKAGSVYLDAIESNSWDSRRSLQSKPKLAGKFRSIEIRLGLF